MKTPTTSVSVALSQLFEDTVALYLRLSADAAAIHRAGELSGPRRTLMVALSRSGPQSVAHLARARAQARQRLQPLVNRLIADGLLEARPNPVHVQSPLIALTARGQRAVTHILSIEDRLQARLRPKSTVRSMRLASKVLRDVRETLEQQLPGLLREGRRTARRRRGERR
jgi:DNA-binding MarR family transcriptional regulator